MDHQTYAEKGNLNLLKIDTISRRRKEILRTIKILRDKKKHYKMPVFYFFFNLDNKTFLEMIVQKI